MLLTTIYSFIEYCVALTLDGKNKTSRADLMIQDRLITEFYSFKIEIEL